MATWRLSMRPDVSRFLLVRIKRLWSVESRLVVMSPTNPGLGAGTGGLASGTAHGGLTLGTVAGCLHGALEPIQSRSSNMFLAVIMWFEILQVERGICWPLMINFASSNFRLLKCSKLNIYKGLWPPSSRTAFARSITFSLLQAWSTKTPAQK